MQEKHSRSVIVFTLVLSVIVSGCTTSGQYHSIVFGGEPGDEIGVKNNTFVMKGSVSVGVGAAEEDNFSDVAVVLYDERKQVIERFQIGTLSTNPEYFPTSSRINITSERIPTYVVIESPDFWTAETTLEIEGHELQNGTYHTYPVGKNHKFPDE